MTHPVCPYCRAPVDSTQEEVVVCEGCDTVHHRDCYQENGGCTIFGCRCAPADEPKLHLSPPDLSATPSVSRPAPAPRPFSTPSMFGLAAAMQTQAPTQSVPSMAEASPEEHKSKMTFVMLGVLLGWLGAHNFYSGYKKKAIIQICLTVLTLGFGAPMSWIWAIIDVLTVEKDSRGVQFQS